MVPHEDEHEDLAPSRTQVKKQMSALQKLAEDLIGLGPDLVRKAPLPEDLQGPVMESFAMKKHEARRRHFQFLGKLMRDVDPQPIRDYIEVIRSGRQAQTGAFHEVERWRDRVVDGDDDLVNELIQRFGHMDIQRFRQLVRNARKERAAGKKPKASRELFRMLRGLREQEAAENDGDT